VAPTTDSLEHTTLPGWKGEEQPQQKKRVKDLLARLTWLPAEALLWTFQLCFCPMLLPLSEPEGFTELRSRGGIDPKEPSSQFFSVRDGSALFCHLWHLSLLVHV